MENQNMTTGTEVTEQFSIKNSTIFNIVDS